MQLTTTLTILASASTVFANVLGERATNEWCFNIYQNANCDDRAGSISQIGNQTNFNSCVPPYEYAYTSVYVGQNGNGRCTITFYQTVSGNKCSSPVAANPGAIQLGACYTFPSGKRPVTYGVVCK